MIGVKAETAEINGWHSVTPDVRARYNTSNTEVLQRRLLARVQKLKTEPPCI
jgi:hypothetical protein